MDNSKEGTDQKLTKDTLEPLFKQGSIKYVSSPVVIKTDGRVVQDKIRTGSHGQMSINNVVNAAVAGHSSGGKTEIQLEKKDGIVKHIDVLCGCGRKIRIILKYE